MTHPDEPTAGGASDRRLLTARALREIGELLRLSGESRFRSGAYERGADAVAHTTLDLERVTRPEQLLAIPGIGKALAGTIYELLHTGRSSLLERLRARFPPGIVEMLHIPHLGLKKIEALHRALGIASRQELEAACVAGRVREVRGFGPATEQRILAALRAPPAASERHLLVNALATAETVLDDLRGAKAVARADLAGSARRRKETVGTIHLVAATSAQNQVLDHFEAFPARLLTVSRTASDARIRLLQAPEVHLHCVQPQQHAAAMVHFTGAAAHLQKLQARARALGLDLSATALRTVDGAPLRLDAEEDLYDRLDLPFIPPELREDCGEVEAAIEGTLPADLVNLEDVSGIAHAHTTYSDGNASIEEMAVAAQAMGMRYLTITDHSATASYARGVTEDRLQRQWEEIARVQERVGIRLLRGTESDILRDGSLDYPEALLERFDVIIASIHARHHMSGSEMTSRVMRAMRHPLFKIWGHPLGRLLNKRPPFECDVERILDTIAASRAAIEINGDPRRLDLEPRWVRAARERGIRFVLSADAHSTNGLRNIRFAVAMARRGWVRRDEVLNTRSADHFQAAVRPL